MKETYWKYSLIILIIGLGILLFRQAQPFMNGILGGFTLYLLLRNPTHWLQQKINGSLAVWTCEDEVNNVWRCGFCNTLHRFEADGPEENGFACCPYCGKIIDWGDGEGDEP